MCVQEQWKMKTQEATNDLATTLRTRSEADDQTILASHRSYQLGLAYGRQIYRLRWFVLAFWIIALVASVPLASKISEALSGGGFSF